MEKDNIKERLLNAYDYLYETGKIHSVTELADKMGRSRPSVSRALNGVPEYLNEKFLKAFTDTFDMISINYLLNGNCDMFTNKGMGALENNNDNQKLNECAAIIEKAVEKATMYADKIISSLENQLSGKDEIIKTKQETIDLQKEVIHELRQRLQNCKVNEDIPHFPYEQIVSDVTEKEHAHI